MVARVLVVTLLLPLLSWREAACAASDPLLDRVLRHDIEQRSPSRLEAAFAAAAAPPWEFDFGAAYSNSPQATAWEAPVSLFYAFANGDLLSVSSGYIRQDDAGHSSGLDDFAIRYGHNIQLSDRLTLKAVAVVVIPAGGDVGSTTATQVGQLGFAYKLTDSWNAGGSFAAIHVDQVDAGIDNWGARYVLNISRSIGTASNAALRFIRTVRGGADSVSKGEFEYDFPLTKSLSGYFTVDHAWTSGHRDDAVELDLAFAW